MGQDSKLVSIDHHVGPDRAAFGSPTAKILDITSHRPWPLPEGRWIMRQRWNDLLFAHWPVPANELAYRLPPGVVVDEFDGTGWVGVVPFWMDHVRFRGLPSVPGTSQFPEINLRTYVRERSSGKPGVYFFSLDTASALAVVVARTAFHLPYHWARITIRPVGNPRNSRSFTYNSHRRLSRQPVNFRASYRVLGHSKPHRISKPGSIEHFLTERYALFTADHRGNLLRGDIHHAPWPLEPAEAEFQRNDLGIANGIVLPSTAPLLHYSRQLSVYLWPLTQV